MDSAAVAKGRKLGTRRLGDDDIGAFASVVEEADGWFAMLEEGGFGLLLRV